MWSGFRATFNFRKFKVALNPHHRIKTLQKVISYRSYHNSIKKNGAHRARFRVTGA